ncbi:T9SS type A sorting domain-containing protein [Maribellus comscasis]|uniref:T9SS type A sorting domain-containing protein n=1 Tax=Maribellus comscasis TaxID=2681766 RepID=A0A6I6KAH6_9BACT|nr:FISUMP domain-containing protein [Maribellus comscasis]QGY47184.1 T9SS type A sorting domain-containing protein [Maribellus comscasis]
MKKFTFLLVILAITYSTMAQDYQITFEPVAGGEAIDSIRVFNMVNNESVKLDPGETLQLGVTTSSELKLLGENQGSLYPNPFNEKSILSFTTKKREDVVLSIYDATGKSIIREKRTLNPGNQHFKIAVPTAGIYYISALTDDQNYSCKGIYTGAHRNSASIQYEGNTPIESFQETSLLKSASKGLTYADGDVLHYVCYSGNNTSVIGDSPTGSKTVSVEFYECKIGEKYYKTVRIGEQVWMAENLEYLPQVNGQDDMSTSEEKYYVYNYDGTDVAEAKATDYYQTYGSLLNVTAAIDNAPRGWRLPTNEDWSTLRNFINTDQGTSEKAGQHLKATAGWIEEGAGNGPDTYGFSAVPNGRFQSGGYCCATGYSFLWSSTEVNAEEGHKFYIVQTDENLYDSDAPKSSGHAVRYIMSE